MKVFMEKGLRNFEEHIAHGSTYRKEKEIRYDSKRVKAFLSWIKPCYNFYCL